MLTKTHAIVLHTLKYSDTKLIIDLLTETEGRVSCIANVSKTGKGRIKRQLFQPLTLLEVIYESRPSASLSLLKDARVTRPYKSIPLSPIKLTIAMFMSEFVGAVTRSEQSSSAMFNYVVDSLLWLDECSDHYSNFHLVFAMRLTRFLGFYPNTEHYNDGMWFDMRASSFTPQAPLHNDVLAPAEARLIGLMLRMNYSTMHLFRMTRSERNRLLDIIMQYYRIHIPEFKDLKSISVLREISG